MLHKIFMSLGARDCISDFQAKNIDGLTSIFQNLPIDEITPLRMKQSIVGSGRAAKEQVQFMVQRLLRLAQAPGADASDALGCALAWWQTMAHQGAVQESSRSSTKVHVS